MDFQHSGKDEFRPVSCSGEEEIGVFLRARIKYRRFRSSLRSWFVWLVGRWDLEAFDSLLDVGAVLRFVTDLIDSYWRAFLDCLRRKKGKKVEGKRGNRCLYYDIKTSSETCGERSTEIPHTLDRVEDISTGVFRILIFRQFIHSFISSQPHLDLIASLRRTSACSIFNILYLTNRSDLPR